MSAEPCCDYQDGPGPVVYHERGCPRLRGPAWDRVARVVMSTLHEPRPIEWSVEELPREPDQPENVRVFRYVYRLRPALDSTDARE